FWQVAASELVGALFFRACACPFLELSKCWQAVVDITRGVVIVITQRGASPAIWFDLFWNGVAHIQDGSSGF
ncbi:unnamed protein product, partial [Musa textilis]